MIIKWAFINFNFLNKIFITLIEEVMKALFSYHQQQLIAFQC